MNIRTGFLLFLFLAFETTFHCFLPAVKFMACLNSRTFTLNCVHGSSCTALQAACTENTGLSGATRAGKLTLAFSLASYSNEQCDT